MAFSPEKAELDTGCKFAACPAIESQLHDGRPNDQLEWNKLEGRRDVPASKVIEHQVPK